MSARTQHPPILLSARPFLTGRHGEMMWSGQGERAAAGPLTSWQWMCAGRPLAWAARAGAQARGASYGRRVCWQIMGGVCAGGAHGRGGDGAAALRGQGGQG
jgi:hypothetical protein